MTSKWIETLTGPLEQKKQYRQTKARVAELPEPYNSAAEACHRYALQSGRLTDGDSLVQMYSDLADLFAQAAADGANLRDILGEDPVDFIEDFTEAYAGKQWIDKERTRLRSTIASLEKPSAEEER